MCPVRCQTLAELDTQCGLCDSETWFSHSKSLKHSNCYNICLRYVCACVANASSRSVFNY